MNVTSHKTFLKSYARLSVIQQKQIHVALMLFKNNRTDLALHDHALTGKMKSLRAFSAGHDLRVIYREEGGFVTIVPIDTGTHNQVY